MKNNPLAPKVPCHRVVAASGELHGFAGSVDPNGSEILRKAQMLRNEGIAVVHNKVNGQQILEPSGLLELIQSSS